MLLAKLFTSSSKLGLLRASGLRKWAEIEHLDIKEAELKPHLVLNEPSSNTLTLNTLKTSILNAAPNFIHA